MSLLLSQFRFTGAMKTRTVQHRMSFRWIKKLFIVFKALNEADARGQMDRNW